MFSRHDEEREETLADYMVKMLTSREISLVNSVPGEPVKESPKTVKPGDWILIKSELSDSNLMWLLSFYV